MNANTDGGSNLEQQTATAKTPWDTVEAPTDVPQADAVADAQAQPPSVSLSDHQMPATPAPVEQAADETATPVADHAGSQAGDSSPIPRSSGTPGEGRVRVLPTDQATSGQPEDPSVPQATLATVADVSVPVESATANPSSEPAMPSPSEPAASASPSPAISDDQITAALSAPPLANSDPLPPDAFADAFVKHEPPPPSFAAPDPAVVADPQAKVPLELVSEATEVASVASAAVSAPQAARRGSGGTWTIPLLCAGLALLACCLLIPQADENRRLTYERERLRQDLEQAQRQAAINDEFIKRVSSDPNLAERLAQRQLKAVREGTAVLELKDSANREEMSPFLLVTLPPPPPLAPYKPVGGRFAELCRNPKSRLHLIGGGLFLVAAGLVLGASGRRDD